MSGLRKNDPELLTEARVTKDLAAAATSQRAPQLLLIHLLKVSVSKEPGGLYQLGLKLQGGGSANAHKDSWHTAEKGTAL